MDVLAMKLHVLYIQYTEYLGFGHTRFCRLNIVN